MTTHLIQPRELFGPPERWEELRTCWDRNDAAFDAVTVAPGRATFNEMFALCRPDAVNVIANSDIYFERDNLRHAFDSMHPRECFALSRWDVDASGHANLWNHADSQDAWVFHGIPHGIDADFPMGIPGCDNHLAWMIDRAGYMLTNPCFSIRAYHLHNVKWRSYLAEPDAEARGGRKIERIQPPYKLVKPTTL